MSTFDKLQVILNSTISYTSMYAYKNPIRCTTCVDGVSLSIQASRTHYCSPRENVGPYTSVEVWCLLGISPDEVTQFEYSDDEPTGYVPIEAVVAFLDAHGGIAE